MPAFSRCLIEISDDGQDRRHPPRSSGLNSQALIRSQRQRCFVLQAVNYLFGICRRKLSARSKSWSNSAYWAREIWNWNRHHEIGSSCLIEKLHRNAGETHEQIANTALPR